MNKRLISIDILRVMSILAVLLIHTTTRILEVTHYNLYAYPLTLFLNQIARFAVPLFFLISGFVLELSAGPEINYFEYFKRRFSKIVFPYVFWSLIYYYFIYNQNHDNLIRVILTGNASYQLYFIPALSIFYLAFPLLHKIYKVLASVPVLTILGSLEIWLMIQDYYIRQFAFVDPVRIAILGYFFFILGMVAARNKDKILEIAGRFNYFLIILTTGLAFYIFGEGMTRYFKTYNIEAFYSQWRPSVLIYTLSLGAVLFYAFEKSRREYELLEKLSKLSYLVFFIHVIILEVIWKLFGHNLFDSVSGNIIGKISFDMVFFATVAAVSFGLAYIIHKIPNLSKITA